MIYGVGLRPSLVRFERALSSENFGSEPGATKVKIKTKIHFRKRLKSKNMTSFKAIPNLFFT